MNLKWKVCGMKTPDNIAGVLQLRPDYMGFIFYKKSSRYVGVDWPGPGSDFPETTAKVGVFVNEELEQLKLLADRYRLDYLQLHGDETPEYCRIVSKAGYQIIKAVGLRTDADHGRLAEYSQYVEYFLFDTPSQQYGGTGKTFDWSLLETYIGQRPFFLSGGLSTENVQAVSTLRHPDLWALDVNSRFETEPGIKNIVRLKEFKEQLQKL